MDPKRWQQIDQLFHSALECESVERSAFLTQACKGDESLRREVESLLGSHDQSDSFIEAPASDIAAELLAEKEARLAAGQPVGPYKIVSLLGEGGMGEVYLAEDSRLGRQVALKRLPAQFTLDAERVRRFEQEARAASALNHPNIVTIHEIGHSDSLHYITTEFIDGETLRQHMARIPMKLDEVLDVAAQIVSALAAAHAAGIVHRDIKPENIMIRPDGYVKILDFGLAKLVEQKNKTFLGIEDETSNENQTAQGVILGTVSYMSPEQAKGDEVDERTDIFSLGTVIYEMISGSTPFQGDSMSETFANLINKEPWPFSRFASNVPDELQRIVVKMLEKNTEERYQTMNVLLSDLRGLRKNLAFDEELERLPASENGNINRSSLVATGKSNRSATVTKHSLSQKIRSHNPLFVFALVVLLIGVIGLGYYFLFTRSASSSASGKKSIAVLPIKSANSANRNEIYEIGITDSLINKLRSISGLVVRPLSATRKYADLEQDPLAAGREQQVDYVLVSTYQLAGGEIKVTSQLLNVGTGQIEGTYRSEQDAANVFVMQDAIAGEVGKELMAKFAITSIGQMANRGTTNEEAYGLYLQGRNLTFNRTPAGARKAVEYFEQAIRLDPNFARAYSGMAHALIASGNLGGDLPRVEYEKAKKVVQKALALDSDLAEGYAVLGELEFTYEWDFSAAEKDLLHAIELEPNTDVAHEQYASLLVARGRFDEAMAEIKTALEIDPTSLTYQMNRGRMLYQARRYQEAILQLRRVIEVDENHATAYGWLWLAYEINGDEAQAYEWFMKSQKRINSDHVNLFEKAYASAGWRGVRQQFFELSKIREEQKPSANYFAMARQCALLDNKELAFEYLDKAIEKRQGQMVQLNVEPSFDILRDDPRFDALVRRVGLK